MKRNMIKTMTAGMAIAVTLSTMPVNVMAAKVQDFDVWKDENVYATLMEDGSVQGIYVVNSYNLAQDTKIEDYGTYTSVKNLTSNELIEMTGDKVSVEAKAGKFYYQGNLESTQLPWNISIQYLLDGEEISAEDLAGASGNLKILIHVTKNAAVNEVFFENYLLQVTLLLDTDLCQNIVAEGATTANSGNDKQLLYNIMAGNEKEIEVTCDVTDFEMDSISFKGVRSSFDISADSIDTSEITEETTKISDAATTLDDAAGKVSDGVKSLQDGSAQIRKALEKLDSNSDTLTEGSANVLQALKTLDAKLQKLSISSQDISKLVTASGQIKSGISSLAEGAGTLDSALSFTTMNQLIWTQLATKSSNQVTQENQQKLEAALTSQNVMTQLSAMPDSDLKTAMVSYVTAAQNYVAVNQAYRTGLETYLTEVRGSVDSKSGSSYLAVSASQLSSSYTEFDETIQSLATTLGSLAENMTVLKESVNTLATQYATLDEGITSYAEGVGSILSGYATLEDGIATLQEGTDQLKEGTEEFELLTQDIDSVVEEKIDNMVGSLTGSDFEVVSFVSDENTNVDNVQFVMTTKEIVKPEADETEQVQETKNFWERFLDLFR